MCGVVLEQKNIYDFFIGFRISLQSLLTSINSLPSYQNFQDFLFYKLKIQGEKVMILTEDNASSYAYGLSQYLNKWKTEKDSKNFGGKFNNERLRKNNI